MIHSSYYQPVVMPIFVDDTLAQIDRVQALTATTTLNRTKIEEVGRVGIVDWKKQLPSVSISLTQLEYGNIQIYQKLSNKLGVTQVNTTDFKTSSFDLCGYETDDNGNFLGTIYYPNLRLSAMSLNIGSPEALIERRFTFVGEDEIIYENTNKYVVTQRYVAPTTGTNQTFTISSPTPLVDPDISGQFLIRVVATSLGVSTLLNPGTDWSYDGVSSLHINIKLLAGDTIWVWYTASTYIPGQTTFTPNNTDVAGISGDSVSIFLVSNNYLYRLQSVAIDTTFNREDIKEIGNQNIVARGVRDVTNRIVLGRILETWSIEEVLRGVAGLNYGKLDVKNYKSNMRLQVQIFSDNTKKNFKLGYEYISLSPTGVDANIPLNDYVKKGITLEGEIGFITNIQGELY